MPTRRLNRLGLPLIVAGLLSATAWAGEPARSPGLIAELAAQANVSAVKPPPIPLLWKVSDDDNAVYLLGSFHLLKSDDYPLSGDIDAAFEASDKLVFEVPPEQMFAPDMALKFIAAAGYSDDRTLSKVLPAPLREKFNRVLGQRGVSIAQFDQYEPWFVTLSLVLGVSQQMGFSAEQGLDQFLMRKAAGEEKPTAGLETMDDQLRVMDAAPMAEQIKNLEEFLDKPQEMPGLLKSVHDAWRSGDLSKLDALTRADMKRKTPESYRMVNVERNEAWLPQIRKMLDDAHKGNTLVVVGAVHLLGDDGLVERLRAKGYRVERVCSACSPSQPLLPPAPAEKPGETVKIDDKAADS